MACFLDDNKITDLYKKYVDVVYRVSFMYLKNEEDSKDIVSNVFIKLCSCNKEFNDDEHIKSWLILCAKNMCKNKLKYWFNKVIDITKVEEASINDPNDDILKLILTLPDKYRIVIYLYYYEGYDTKEIAEKLKLSAATIRSRLHRARALLEKII